MEYFNCNQFGLMSIELNLKYLKKAYGIFEIVVEDEQIVGIKVFDFIELPLQINEIKLTDELKNKYKNIIDSNYLCCICYE